MYGFCIRSRVYDFGQSPSIWVVKIPKGQGSCHELLFFVGGGGRHDIMSVLILESILHMALLSLLKQAHLEVQGTFNLLRRH